MYFIMRGSNARTKLAKKLLPPGTVKLQESPGSAGGRYLNEITTVMSHPAGWDNDVFCESASTPCFQVSNAIRSVLRLDVLVHMKNIIRVMLPFDLCQPCEV
jgi:hypothetical protein